jgi:choline kinase
VLILNSDVLFDPAVLGHVLSVDGSALAYDSSSGDEDEHMKIRTRRGVLLRVSKALPPAYSHGENLGLVHLKAAAARAAFAAADRRVHRGGDKEWVGAAFTDIARQHSIACVDVAGQPWVEIDFPEDLDSARRRVWPAIHASVLQRRTQATLASPQASATSREVAT